MYRHSNGKVRRSAEEWSVIISDWESSGDSVEHYCRVHGVSCTSFRKWRKKLEVKSEVANFVKVDSSREFRSPRAILELPGGVRLTVEGCFDV